MTRELEPATRTLLLEIARCFNLVQGMKEAAHPCSQIVGMQKREMAGIHLPEPWCGDIEKAPVLFVSSNPGFTTEELFPSMSWQDDDIADFFAHRFGGGRRPWILDGNRRLNIDGTHSVARPYWSSIKRRAGEILGREPAPGVDYAMTEIVHCKSRKEMGVKAALAECSGRYLRRVLQASGAAVIVGIGGKVRQYLLNLLGLEGPGGLIGPMHLEGRDRVVMFLGHPAGAKAKKLANCLSAAEQQRLRAFLTIRT